MNKMKTIEFLAICLAIVPMLGSCSKDNGTAAETDVSGNTPFFDFATTDKYDLKIDYDVPQGYQVFFEVYGENPLQTEKGVTTLRTDVKPLSKGYTDERGSYNEKVVLPNSTEQVWVYSPSLGVPNLLHASVKGTAVTLGVNDFVEKETSAANTVKAAATRTNPVAGHVLLGGWSWRGRPDYLSTADKVTVTGAQMKRLNDVFNEGKPVSKLYFQTSDIHVSEPAKICVNFITAGSSAQNVLAYYCYPTGQKPSSPAEITNRVLVFPRVSTTAMNWGYIKRGEAVRLKYIDRQGVDHGYEFPAGVSIGWVLYNDGFDALIGRVSTGTAEYFADPDLNVADPSTEKNHVALFKLDDMIFLGFEDTYNDIGDGDCNDCIVRVTASPTKAIDTDIPEVIDPVEENDEAYSIEYEGTLAFEDNWPSYGDYDMNDLVVKYHAKTYFTRYNEAIRSEDRFTLAWCGGAYRNGFGYALPAGAAGAEVTVSRGGEQTSAGLEQGTTEPVVLLFDDSRTETAENTQHPVFEVKTRFASFIAWDDFTPAPYNPFLTIRQRRNHELHLPMYTPTSQMDASLFGINKDMSEPEKGIYYVADVNYPFAIHIVGGDEYVIPAETHAIDTVYPYFSDWARSGGVRNKDWYKHPAN